MLVTKRPQDLIPVFEQGGIIAYPTEAVFGLGCNPDDEKAVLQLLKIKQRPMDKGLILIASDFKQVEKYLKPLNDTQLKCTEPSETTYLYPTLGTAPKWVTGNHNSLAVRITRHPLAKALCESLNSALVSTSANISGNPPAKLSAEIKKEFERTVDALLDGETGNLSNPTDIRDSISGDVIR